MTQRYSHLAVENLREAVLKLDGVEGKKKNSVTKQSQSGVTFTGQGAQVIEIMEPTDGFEPTTR